MASVNRRIRPPSSLANSVLPNDSDDEESELSDVESPSSSPIGRSRFTQVAEDDEEDDEDEDAEGEEDDEDAEGEEVDDDEEAQQSEEEEEDEEVDHDADENSPDDDDEEDYELESAASESAASTPVPTNTSSRSRNVRTVMSRQTKPKTSIPPTPASRSRRPPAPTPGSVSKSKSTKATVLPSSTAHRLTLKMPKDKLRDATSGWASTTQSTEVSSSEAPTPKVTTGNRRGVARATVRSRRKVVEPSSDEEEEEEEEEDEDVDMSDADADGVADDTVNTTMQQQEEEESSEENPFGSDDEDMEVLPIGIQSIVSGTSTPDLARLTKRQRGRIDELYSADLMELPNSGFGPSPANKLHLTADEQALKRTEMARRRRNLTVQKVEEEKMETVNRLLYRQPAKPKGKPKGDETPAVQDGDEDVTMEGAAVEKAVEEKVKQDLPPNGFIRWTNRKEGSVLFVGNTTLQTPVGRIFGGPGTKIEVMEEVESKV